jgi:DNA-binding beta-propeller fold protein YncE
MIVSNHILCLTRHLNVIIFCFACFLSLIAGGCATTEMPSSFSETHVMDSLLVWPPSPQTPRIQYLGSLSKPADLGMQHSWFSRVLDTVFGTEKRQGVMLRPFGVFADADRIYVTDPGVYLLHVFDLKGKRYFQIKNVGDQKLVSPVGIAVDEHKKIYLSDSVLRKVFQFNKDGEYLREIGSSQIFLRPTGIAVDEDRVYVVDTLGHKILVFSKEHGTLLFTFGKKGGLEGSFNYPTNIFIGKDKHLYITDSMNFRVQIFDRDGNVVYYFGKAGDGSGNFSKPKGIAVDSEGHIYVADAHFDTIQIFDKDGRLLLVFGKSGTGGGEMTLPAGVFIDNQDKIYVADSFNKRIQIFQYLKEKNNLHEMLK